jgi:hypothetical protein
MKMEKRKGETEVLSGNDGNTKFLNVPNFKLQKMAKLGVFRKIRKQKTFCVKINRNEEFCIKALQK